MNDQTLGERRVRISFNPSKDDWVDDIKRKTAELIDICQSNQLTANGNAEVVRHWALAMTAYEEAAMWAVKAATTGK